MNCSELAWNGLWAEVEGNEESEVERIGVQRSGVLWSGV